MSAVSSSSSQLQSLALKHGASAVLVGVGGSGMRGLATLLLEAGWSVWGSDQKKLPKSDSLWAKGLQHFESSATPSCSWVVRSAAVSEKDDAVNEAVKGGAKSILYSEFLGEISRIRPVIAIAGSHGKTTCSAWLAYGFRSAGIDIGFLVGDYIPQLETSASWGDPSLPLIMESCEYARSFHFLNPEQIALINVDAEHPDTYPGGLQEVEEAFKVFLSKLCSGGKIFAGLEAPRKFEKYYSENWHSCSATDSQQKIGLYGSHNRLNAALVSEIWRDYGLQEPEIDYGLSTFLGASRRLESLGEVVVKNGASLVLVSDYAHHPVEVHATISAAKERWPRHRLLAVMQPHQAQRFHAYRNQFASCLDLADEVVLLDVYRARDPESLDADVRELIPELQQRNPGRCLTHFPDSNSVIEYLHTHVDDGTVVLGLGAGDIHDILCRLR